MLRWIVSSSLWFAVSLLALPAFGQGPTVKVLTYNIWGLPLGISKDLPVRLKKLCEVFKEKANASDGWDIILLQEAWQKVNQKYLTKCGYAYNARFDKASLSSGVMILSKFPVIEKKRINYPGYGFDPEAFFDAEGIAKKSGVLIKVSHPTIGNIWVATTHLAANYFKPRHYYTGHRRAQFEIFSKWIRDNTAGEPVIMGGDLNLAPNGVSYEPLWDDIPKLLPGFQQADYPSNTCTHCMPNTYDIDDEGKIDHLFGNDFWTPRDGKVTLTETYNIGKSKKRRWINLSDHFGWESTFEFRAQLTPSSAALSSRP